MEGKVCALHMEKRTAGGAGSGENRDEGPALPLTARLRSLTAILQLLPSNASHERTNFHTEAGSLHVHHPPAWT
jgi:hypothetical protein